MSKLEVNAIEGSPGQTLTLGKSGGSVNLAPGAVSVGFTDASMKSDIALLGFKVASNGSLGKYDLADQVIDSFEDSSGVDSDVSSGVAFSNGYMFGADINYTGDGSDGAFSTTDHVNLTVENKNGLYDGDMVIKQYKTLTINAGHVFTTEQPCRGLFIYVNGDCTINGTLSMTSRGGDSNPNNVGGSDGQVVGDGGIQLGLRTSSGTDSFINDGTGFAGAGVGVINSTLNTSNLVNNGTIFTMSKIGAAGGAVQNSTVGTTLYDNGEDGATGSSTISTGGGCSGQAALGDRGGGSNAGGGGTGGCFSAGAGGGSSYSKRNATSGGSYGGAGGYGSPACIPPAGGGAGNPGRDTDFSADGRHYEHAEDGVGGVIWLIVAGNLVIGAAGSIESRGNHGGWDYIDGGFSAGGAIFALHTGSYTVQNEDMVGGRKPPILLTEATTKLPSVQSLGRAGTGGHYVAQLSRDVGDMVMISTSTTALAAPTKGDIVMTYTDGMGTAIVNTDLTAEFSADDGTTWTPMTLVFEGTSGGHNILAAHEVALTSTSGTEMRYRIKTINQSEILETRIQAVSLGWS